MQASIRKPSFDTHERPGIVRYGQNWLPKSARFNTRLSAHIECTIEEIKELEADWDGEGALAVYPEVITRLRKLIEGIRIVRSIEPDEEDILANSNGTVTIKYRGSGYVLIINIGKTNATFALASEPDFHILSKSERLGLGDDSLPPELVEVLFKVAPERHPYWSMSIDAPHTSIK